MWTWQDLHRCPLSSCIFSSHSLSCLLTPPFVWVDTDFLNSQFFFFLFLVPSPAVPLCSRPWIYVCPTYPIFCGLGLPLVACGVFFPNQGLSLQPLHWKHGVLTTELPGRSLTHPIYSSSFHACPSSPFSLSFPSLFCCLPWHPTPVLLPGKSHGWRSLVGCSPRCHEESDMTE